MASRPSSRQRLIQSALTLFAAQGITETTTKQIAEAAEVNEATLFRQFGNKNGLLLAVIEEGAIFQSLSQKLIYQVDQLDAENFEQVLLHYARTFLQALEQVPELVRSLIGESGRYPEDGKIALGNGLTQANQEIADYFAKVAARDLPGSPLTFFETHAHISPQSLASTIHSALLGYLLLNLTSDRHELWSSDEVFLETLFSLLFSSDMASSGDIDPTGNIGAVLGQELQEINDVQEPDESQAPLAQAVLAVDDLPASLVHEILLRAKKKGAQEYAIFYTLFATGITPQELVRLQRIHHVSDREQHLIQVPSSPSCPGASRQVPVNQLILGKRYGSYQKNPLTQWLKTRKDNVNSLFLSTEQSADQMPITLIDVENSWQSITHDLMTLAGQSPHIFQIQQTWCIDLLMRGVTSENIQILTGWPAETLTVYIQRAQEKAAIDQVMQLDKK